MQACVQGSISSFATDTVLHVVTTQSCTYAFWTTYSDFPRHKYKPVTCRYFLDEDVSKLCLQHMCLYMFLFPCSQSKFHLLLPQQSSAWRKNPIEILHFLGLVVLHKAHRRKRQQKIPNFFWSWKKQCFLRCCLKSFLLLAHLFPRKI